MNGHDRRNRVPIQRDPSVFEPTAPASPTVRRSNRCEANDAKMRARLHEPVPPPERKVTDVATALLALRGARQSRAQVPPPCAVR